MKEAVLYSKLKNNGVKCHVCGWECVIGENQKGFCQTRVNKKGKLYSLIYGKIYGGIQIDPIEKKPMYHFYPGTLVASVGSFGCNFHCKQCLNWHCSYKYNFNNLIYEIKTTPKQLVDEVKKLGHPGIAFTYNEPTIWLEFVHDCAKLARQNNIYTVLVTNGYLTPQSLDYIGPYIMGYSVDFKGFSDESYQKQGSPIKFIKILEAAKKAQQKWHMKIEITTMVIPGINDDEKELREMTKWIYKNLGFSTPWHLSQYSPELAPDLKFQNLPRTSLKQLKAIYEIGKKQGLNFVFVWAPHDGFAISDSLCPQCRKIVIKRSNWQVERLGIDKEGRCNFCKKDLGIIW